MATTVNAPQPVPGEGAPAEVFDSTVTPAVAPVSSIGLNLVQTAEAPIHAGELNDIDPFLKSQFIIIDATQWATNQDPGTLLWSAPIHPSYMSPYLAHLSKMYNTYAGGSTYAVKIAGTGFHAGAVVCARIPPNLRPQNIRTMAALSAFEFRVFDPKMIEVFTMTVMDQRNIMYHYLPLDINNRDSFGGWFAIYVMLPLNTSATGAGEISIQIFCKPAPNFRFAQLRPIQLDAPNIYVPQDLVDALDFDKRTQESPCTGDTIVALEIQAVTAPPLKQESLACYKVSAESMQKHPYWVPMSPSGSFWNRNVSGQVVPLPNEPMPFKIVKDTTTNTIIKITQGDQANKKPGVIKARITYSDESFNVMAFSPELFDLGGDGWNGYLSVRVNLTKADTEADLQTQKQFSHQWIMPVTVSNMLANETIELTFNWPGGEIMSCCWDSPNVDTAAFNNFDLSVPLTWDRVKLAICQWPFTNIINAPISYIPPIAESYLYFVTFSDPAIAQTKALADILRTGSYKDFIRENQSMIFEVIDVKTNLPLFPVRLHYDGYFTTFAHTTPQVFSLGDYRFSFQFTGFLEAGTPMTSGTKPVAAYLANQVVARSSNLATAVINRVSNNSIDEPSTTVGGIPTEHIYGSMKRNNSNRKIKWLSSYPSSKV